jgi:hypothetical protein
MKIAMEKSWLLQDRLVFPNMVCTICTHAIIKSSFLTVI